MASRWYIVDALSVYHSQASADQANVALDELPQGLLRASLFSLPIYLVRASSRHHISSATSSIEADSLERLRHSRLALLLQRIASLALCREYCLVVCRSLLYDGNLISHRSRHMTAATYLSAHPVASYCIYDTLLAKQAADECDTHILPYSSRCLSKLFCTRPVSASNSAIWLK